MVRDYSNFFHIIAKLCGINLALFIMVMAGCSDPNSDKQENTLSPNYRERESSEQVDMLIIHYTSVDLSKTLDLFADESSDVSSHYVIAQDGTVIEIVPEEFISYHAGTSYWQGRMGINDFSIGIELVNSGDEPFPQAQMVALADLTSDIIERYCIPPENVLGHSDIASNRSSYNRKGDPGVLFDWQWLSTQGIGLWVEEGKAIDSEQPDHITIYDVQDMLSQYGYAVPRHGKMDEYTQLAIQAFQLHFYPEKVDGQIDSVTIARLRQLLAIVNEKDRKLECAA